MQIAKRELMNIIDEEELKSAVVRVLANKQDLPEALSTAEIASQLGLDSIVDKKMDDPCHVGASGRWV
jgi:signal recognition particle receptor subunit beta